MNSNSKRQKNHSFTLFKAYLGELLFESNNKFPFKMKINDKKEVKEKVNRLGYNYQINYHRIRKHEDLF